MDLKDSTSHPVDSFVEAMFLSFPRTKDVVEMKLNLTEHMRDKYDALLAEGKNENEALGSVVADFGSVEEIRRALGLPEAASLLPEPDPELERLEAEYRAFQPPARAARTVAVMLLILSPVVGPAADSVMLMFLFIAVGVGLLLYFNGRLSDYRELISRRSALLGLTDGPVESERVWMPGASYRRLLVYGMLCLGAVVAYLVLGLWTDLWHPGWIIFLLVPLAIGILEIIREGKNQGGEQR